MPSVVIGQKPKGGRQGEYVSHPWEAVSLCSCSQITAPENNVMHSSAGRWDPGRLGLWREVPDTELSVSNPAEPPPGCRNEIRESFTLHRDL